MKISRTSPEVVIDWSIMTHQPVSVNECDNTSLNAILLHVPILPVLILSPNALLNTQSECSMQSISVVKLFRVYGYRAVNPPAAWICHVSERAVKSRYIFCTAFFSLLFAFYRGTPGKAFTKCLLYRNHWNLTHKWAVLHNQCTIHLWLWCQLSHLYNHL